MQVEGLISKASGRQTNGLCVCRALPQPPSCRPVSLRLPVGGAEAVPQQDTVPGRDPAWRDRSHAPF